LAGSIFYDNDVGGSRVLLLMLNEKFFCHT
jgi:hypothetical protein